MGKIGTQAALSLGLVRALGWRETAAYLSTAAAGGVK